MRLLEGPTEISAMPVTSQIFSLFPAIYFLNSWPSSSHTRFSHTLISHLSHIDSGYISVCNEYATLFFTLDFDTKDHCLLCIFLEYLLILDQIKWIWYNLNMTCLY